MQTTFNFQHAFQQTFSFEFIYQSKIKLFNIKLFHFNLKIINEYLVDDILNNDKKIIYRDVLLFAQQIRRVNRIKSWIEFYIHTCFRDAIMQWFFVLNEKIQNWLIIDVNKLLHILIEKYRFFRSLTLNKLKREHYTLQNVQNMRSIDEYMQVILRYDRSIDIHDDDVILIYVWNNFDFEFQRDIRAFVINNIIDNFVKRLQQIFELWFKKTR